MHTNDLSNYYTTSKYRRRNSWLLSMVFLTVIFIGISGCEPEERIPDPPSEPRQQDCVIVQDEIWVQDPSTGEWHKVNGGRRCVTHGEDCPFVDEPGNPPED